jgi:hypothetical protein
MTTNLTAAVFLIVVTNWTPNSVTMTVPVSGLEFGRCPMVTNYQGVVRTNTVATINWKGKPHQVVLESSIRASVNGEGNVLSRTGENGPVTNSPWIMIEFATPIESQVSLDIISNHGTNTNPALKP